jgi:hypothetical protein
MSESGHSLHFGSISMSGLPPTTTEWRTFTDAMFPSLATLAYASGHGGRAAQIDLVMQSLQAHTCVAWPATMYQVTNSPEINAPGR